VNEVIVKKIWNAAIEYLNLRVSQEDLNLHLRPPQLEKANSFEKIYFRLVASSKNRNMMAKVIGDTRKYELVLCRFQPDAVLSKYKNDWELLAKNLFVARHGHIDDEYLSRKGNLFNVFAKSCISAGEYLDGFDSPEQFVKSIDSEIKNSGNLVKVPKRISSEIYGFGFALACDFLKECGWTQFPKPDVHLNKVFHNFGLSSKKDVEVFGAIQEFSKIVDKTPYEVDKVFWLIGSGRLHLVGQSFKTSIEEFEKASA